MRAYRNGSTQKVIGEETDRRKDINTETYRQNCAFPKYAIRKWSTIKLIGTKLFDKGASIFILTYLPFLILQTQKQSVSLVLNWLTKYRNSSDIFPISEYIQMTGWYSWHVDEIGFPAEFIFISIIVGLFTAEPFLLEVIILRHRFS